MSGVTNPHPIIASLQNFLRQYEEAHGTPLTGKLVLTVESGNVVDIRQLPASKTKH